VRVYIVTIHSNAGLYLVMYFLRIWYMPILSFLMHVRLNKTM